MFDDENKEAAEKAAKELADAKAEAAQAKAEAEAIKAEKEALEKEAKGLRSKEFNFKRLRDMTEQEKEALTEKELELQKRQEALEDRQAQHDRSVKDDWRNSAIEKASRGDAEKAKKITEALKDLSGEETDRASIEARVAKAAKLAREDAAFDHVGTAFSSMGGEPPEKPEARDYADTPEGVERAKALGFRFANRK